MLNSIDCGKPNTDQLSTLEHHIQRLQVRLDCLASRSERFTWVRVTVFFVGLALSIAAWLTLAPTVARLVSAAAILAFGVVVWLHRRLDGQMRRYTIWLDLQKDQLARLNLDWQRLPVNPLPAPRSPLDIDLDLTGPRSLHQLLDLSLSREGSQRLADWLTDPHPDIAQIADRQPVVKELKEMRRFRQRLLLNLRLVSKEQLNGARLLQWLQAAVPGQLVWLLIAGFCLTTLNIILLALFIQQKLPAYWVFSFLVSQVFYYLNVGQLKPYLEAVVELDAELDKFSRLLLYLEGYPLRNRPALEKLLTPFRNPEYLPSRILRRIKWVTAGVGVRSNPVIGLLLNLFLPWDFLVAYLSARMRPAVAKSLPGWLETWVQLEALACLANFAELHPQAAFPEVDPQAVPVFQARGLCHPLILQSRTVPNDFSLSNLGELALVTGSNMAGKSTFLKTVGINCCLAFAGGPVMADSLRCRPLRLHTCVRITDSIADGISYFYAEVKRLRSLLDELRSADARPVLYLIDEIFRGTNNRERLIGSQAFVRALIGAHGAGLIATHDLELAHLAEQDGRVLNYHFRDEVSDGRLVFDFLIRPGPSPTTNALKIMELEGLPIA